MRIVEFLLNLLGWIQIVVTSTLIGFVIGLAIYYFKNDTGLTVMIILMVIGGIIGAVWATRLWIKHGMVDWLSGIRRVK